MPSTGGTPSRTSCTTCTLSVLSLSDPCPPRFLNWLARRDPELINFIGQLILQILQKTGLNRIRRVLRPGSGGADVPMSSRLPSTEESSRVKSNSRESTTVAGGVSTALPREVRRNLLRFWLADIATATLLQLGTTGSQLTAWTWSLRLLSERRTCSLSPRRLGSTEPVPWIAWSSLGATFLLSSGEPDLLKPGRLGPGINGSSSDSVSESGKQTVLKDGGFGKSPFRDRARQSNCVLCKRLALRV